MKPGYIYADGSGDVILVCPRGTFLFYCKDSCESHNHLPCAFSESSDRYDAIRLRDGHHSSCFIPDRFIHNLGTDRKATVEDIVLAIVKLKDERAIKILKDMIKKLL